LLGQILVWLGLSLAGIGQFGWVRTEFGWFRTEFGWVKTEFVWVRTELGC